jgi:S-adenosylmethionine decarboxylase
VEAIQRVMVEASRRAGATIIDQRFHRFTPQGVTGVLILAESHLAIHTWPEHRFAALDLFLCGQKMNADDCIQFLIESFGSKRHRCTLSVRGEILASQEAFPEGQL